MYYTFYITFNYIYTCINTYTQKHTHTRTYPMQIHPLSTALVRLNLKLHIATVLRIVPVLASRAASFETSAAVPTSDAAAS